MNTFLFFPGTTFKCCCFSIKKYNIETEVTIRSILYSSRPIRLQIFCTLMIVCNVNISSYHFDSLGRNTESRIIAFFFRLSNLVVMVLLGLCWHLSHIFCVFDVTFHVPLCWCNRELGWGLEIPKLQSSQWQNTSFLWFFFFS